MGVGASVALSCGNPEITEAPNSRPVYEYADVRTQAIPDLAVTVTASTVAVIQEPAFASEQADRGVAYQESPTLPPPNLHKLDMMMIDLDMTYNARQCIADHESRDAGLYTAENPISSASGISQWKNSSWQNYLGFAEKYYGLKLTSLEEDLRGGRFHAAYAEPFTQDLITAFALKHRDLAQYQKPWPYNSCWAQVDNPKQLRPDGQEFGPTLFILSEVYS